jgi:hypothetical protein
MPDFTDRISNAIKIKSLFRGRKDGCVETATAALGGNAQKIEFLARQKIEGRLGNIPVNDNVVGYAGLVIKRSYPIELNDKSKAANLIEKELNDTENLGVMVVYGDKDNGHAAAIIHRRNYPRDVGPKVHVVVDTVGSDTLRMDTVEGTLKPRCGYEPRKVLIIGDKKK